VALYIPLFFALREAIGRRHGGNLLLALFYVVSIVVIWVLFVSTVVGRFEHPIVYLPLPIGLFILFVAARKTLEAAPPGAHHAAGPA
jgi:hypothetical protein